MLLVITGAFFVEMLVDLISFLTSIAPLFYKAINFGRSTQCVTGAPAKGVVCMPNIKSAKKRLRTSEAAHQLNASAGTRVKTCRRTLLEAISKGDKKASEEAFRTYCSVLDRAARKGVIKKNTAVRRKSRAAEKVKALST